MQADESACTTRRRRRDRRRGRPADGTRGDSTHAATHTQGHHTDRHTAAHARRREQAHTPTRRDRRRGGMQAGRASKPRRQRRGGPQRGAAGGTRAHARQPAHGHACTQVLEKNKADEQRGSSRGRGPPTSAEGRDQEGASQSRGARGAPTPRANEGPGARKRGPVQERYVCEVARAGHFAWSATPSSTAWEMHAAKPDWPAECSTTDARGSAQPARRVRQEGACGGVLDARQIAR